MLLISSALAAWLVLALAPAAADKPIERKPLSPADRAGVLNLISVVDLAQQTDRMTDQGAGWDSHVLKSAKQTAYVPFRLTLPAGEDFKSALIYVRAVTRRDGLRASDERSSLRDVLLKGSNAPARTPEVITVGPGELPIGGPAAGSARRSTAAPAEASAILAMQQKAMEQQKAADAAAKRKLETREKDPFLFPFEDYYIADVKAGHLVERALGLPPGEYDVYIAAIDRARLKTSGATILKRTVTVPDFWNEELALSTLILARDINGLKAPLSAAQQLEHPYTFGRAEVLPVAAPSFTTGDVLSIVFQICNYGAPDADVTAEYVFFRTDGGARKLFNRTEPQQFDDADLPAADPFDTHAFASQAVPLQPFPPGQYELEVTVRDRPTRRTATRTVAFTVR